jgi:hypothetical protein
MLSRGIEPGDRVRPRLVFSYEVIGETFYGGAVGVSIDLKQFDRVTDAINNIGIVRVRYDSFDPGSSRLLKGEEIPRLCRGGSSSLTFTGVHPRNSNGEPTKAHAKEKLDGPIGKSKPLGMGVQIPRGIYPEVPPQGAV